MDEQKWAVRARCGWELCGEISKASRRSFRFLRIRWSLESTSNNQYPNGRMN
jgi:hypothetical protein